MSTTKVETLIPLVRVEVPECPDILVQNAILRAAIEFCEKSTFWRETIDELHVSANVAEYDIETPSGATMSEIIWATYDDNPLTAKTESQILAYTSGAPSYYALLNPRVIKIAPTPTGAGIVRLRAALKPKPTATSIRDYVYDEWSEAFYHGALERLFMMPGKPWSNPELALFHQQQFTNAVEDALNIANSSNSNVAYVVQYGGI